MLEVQDLDCVRGGRLLFSKLDFTLEPRSLLQLQGPNGSGKTSLLRIICGLLTPEHGKVLWQGANIRALGEEYSSALTYLGHRNGIKEELTPIENLRVASGLSGRDLDRDQAMDALKQVGLEGRENLPARFLSEGQKRRSALARLITCSTKLWVLDEVFASLDTTAVGLVRSLIEGHLNDGGMAVVATHHPLQISAGSFQQLELGTGVVASGVAAGLVL